MTERAEEIATRLDDVRRRIERAATGAGRDPAEVRLIVVTKFFPASDVRILADLGIGDVAENRHQEAHDKTIELAGLDLAWHFVGGLQSNKAAAVAGYATAVHSVDRAKLVGPLDRGAEAAGGPVDVLVQVSLDPPGRDRRAGIDPTDAAALDDLADRIEGAEHLCLRGLMAVAPTDEDPASAFARLAAIRQTWLERRPEADLLSAGMSGDLEAAIGHGATHVRVGSAVLGSRPSPQ